MTPPRAAIVCVLVALIALVGTAARADVPPPDGEKYVGFAVRVEGLAKFPDHVLVAYPWSTSNGAPTHEHAVIADGAPLRIGRRSPDVVLWAVPKTAWEAFAQTLPPAADEAARRAALDTFFAGKAVVRCDAAPKHVWTLPTSDPRDVVEDVYRAEAIDATTCRLARAPAPAAAATTSGCGCAGGRDAASGLAVLAALGLLVRRARAFAPAP